MRVRQVDTAFDLLELFARDRRPLTLTAIARELAIPKSSAFNIIETLMLRGILYETRPRGGYYPTLRLTDLSRSFDDRQLLAERLRPELEALAQESGETALLSVRENDDIVYIDVVESTSPIRYAAHIGERRPLHTTSSGKAILLSHGKGFGDRIYAAISQRFDAVAAATLCEDLELSAQRGWTEDPGDTLADVVGFGAPILVGHWQLGLALAGPAYRVYPVRERLIAQLLARRDAMVKLLASGAPAADERAGQPSTPQRSLA